MFGSPVEEYYLGKNVWSAVASDWKQRIEVGDAIIDPAGDWDPSTAEAYIDQQIGIEASTRLAQDTYLGNEINTIKKNKVYLIGTTLSQSQINQTDTIYVIKDDLTLTENITVPTNCVLEFDGGSITANGNNDTITGNNTGIEAGFVKIFNTDVTLAGNWNLEEVYPEWFGAVGDSSVDSASITASATDDSEAIQKAFSIKCKRVFLSKVYGITKPIKCTYALDVYGVSSGYSGIKALPSFHSSTVTIDGQEKTIDSLLYIPGEYYDIKWNNIALDGNYKASTSIIALKNNMFRAKMDFVQFLRFYQCALNVYQSDSSIITNCYFRYSFIAIIVSGSTIDYTKPLYRNGDASYIYSPNHVEIRGCNTMLCTFGFILKDSSDVLVDDCLFGYNSLQSIFVDRVHAFRFSNGYFEGEFNCQILIEKDQTTDPVRTTNISTAFDVTPYLRTDGAEASYVKRGYIDLRFTNAEIYGLIVGDSALRCYKGCDKSRKNDDTISGVDATIAITQGVDLSFRKPRHDSYYKVGGVTKEYLYDVAYIKYVSYNDSYIFTNGNICMYYNGYYELNNNILSCQRNNIKSNIDIENKYISDSGNVLNVSMRSAYAYQETQDGYEYYTSINNNKYYLSEYIDISNKVNNTILLEIRYKALQAIASANAQYTITALYDDGTAFVEYKNVLYQQSVEAGELIVNYKYITPANYNVTGKNIVAIAVTQSTLTDGLMVSPFRLSYIDSIKQYYITGLPKSGTSNPNIAEGKGVGIQFFNNSSNINKPIWWNGTDWVDATGTPV